MNELIYVLYIIIGYRKRDVYNGGLSRSDIYRVVV